MKSKITINSLLIILSTSLLSCSDSFLDVKPKGRVIATSITDYNNMLEFSGFVQISFGTWHIMGDDVAGLEPHYSTALLFGTPGTRNHRLFEWADDVYRPDDETDEVAVFYRRIYAANKIIHEVLDAEGGSEQQKKQYRAEALSQRAFAYFNLVNFFGKPYLAATATSDLAVPLILRGDFGQDEFVRASVQEVYDAIIADLSDAIPDLPLVQNTSNRYTKAAAEALLGKVYLFMANPAAAAAQLDNAVAHLPSSFTVSGFVELIDYNTATVSANPIGYVFVGPRIGATATQGHGYPETLQAQLATALNWLGRGAPLVISPETHALYKAGDRRLLLHTNAYGILATGPGPLLPTGLYRSRASFLGNGVGAQLPDIYLLRAEAKARINDLAGAVENLLILRKKRMPAADAEADIPADRDDLVKFIIEERRREFATLGFRWFDMRRLSVDPLFAGAAYTHTLYNADGSVKATYNLKPERFVLRFSEKLMSQSPGLVNNP